MTEWEKLDGKWGLRTNIEAPGTDSDSDELRMTVEEIVAMYKSLNKPRSSNRDMTAHRVFSLFRGIELVDTMPGDNVPILVRRVTERNDAQKRILKCLGMSDIICNGTAYLF